MDENLKIVDFKTYCQSCKYKDNSEDECPCDDCLSIPARESSKRPEYYIRKEE